MSCNVAEFSTLLSRNWEWIYIMKSPLFGSQEENPSSKRQGHSYFCIICLFFFLFCYFFVFMRAKIMRWAKSATTYFLANCLLSPFSDRRLTVGRLALASTQHSTTSAEATYKFCCLNELLHLINFAWILSLPLI